MNDMIGFIGFPFTAAITLAMLPPDLASQFGLVFSCRAAFEKMRKSPWPGAASRLQGVRHRNDEYPDRLAAHVCVCRRAAQLHACRQDPGYDAARGERADQTVAISSGRRVVRQERAGRQPYADRPECH